VIPLIGGVGIRCGSDSLPEPLVPEPSPFTTRRSCASASITQSALPAISALVASNNTWPDRASGRKMSAKQKETFMGQIEQQTVAETGEKSSSKLKAGSRLRHCARL